MHLEKAKMILIAATAAGIGHPAMAQEAPQIFAGGNGEIEATFIDNCVVYYNANGSRKSANSNCSRAQIDRADKGVAAYRREQGMEGYAGSEAPPGGFGNSSDSTPEIIVGDNGYLQVNVGLRCSVYYKSRDRFDRTTGVCSRSDRSAADRAVKGYRNEQGDGATEANRTASGYYNGTSVYRYKSGMIQATATGGCFAYFKANGVMLSASKACTSKQKALAALAVIQFRKEHPSD